MASLETPAETRATLPRVLGGPTAFCVVVGSVIGSGIFLVPAKVADDVPYFGGIALCWVLGGLFSAAGALTLSELAAMMPGAGGPYVYLRAAFGPAPGFLFGWTAFWVVRSGSMATLAAAFARYFAQLLPAPAGIAAEAWQLGVAAAAIAALVAVNVVGTRMAGGLMVVGTAIKVGALAALIALPFALGRVDPARLAPAWPAAMGGSFWSGVLAAMVGVLWAYDGWADLAPMAEEVRDPGRNLPRALIGGMAVLIVVYLSMTVAYHLVLPMEEVRSLKDRPATQAVAADYCRTLLGPAGGAAISVVVMISTFISLNGNAMTGPRTYFAMARDGLFPARLARVHPRFLTPASAIVAQGTWAITLLVVGTGLILMPAPGPSSGLPAWFLAALGRLRAEPLYDMLYTYVIFGATTFYLLSIASVFALRARRPDLPRPYRTWGYPVTPAVFVLASSLLLINMLRTTPIESLAGLGLILLGLPAFAYFRRGGALA